MWGAIKGIKMFGILARTFLTSSSIICCQGNKMHIFPWLPETIKAYTLKIYAKYPSNDEQFSQDKKRRTQLLPLKSVCPMGRSYCTAKRRQKFSILRERISSFKHGAILYNEAEVFSLSIVNPNGRPMLPFDWLIQSSLILALCHKMFSCFLRLRNKFEN